MVGDALRTLGAPRTKDLEFKDITFLILHTLIYH